MTHDQLMNLLHARPFRPYRLRTASGREIPISHPDSIAYGGARTAVVVSGDRWEILDIALVESVEGQNQPAPPVDRSDEEYSKPVSVVFSRKPVSVISFILRRKPVSVVFSCRNPVSVVFSGKELVSVISFI